VTAHGATPVSFGELIEHSDYLVIQTPLTRETHHLIGEAELRRMKPELEQIEEARVALEEGQILGRAIIEI